MLFNHLDSIWSDTKIPFLQYSDGYELYYKDLKNIFIEGIDKINSGDVVALIGDFEPNSIATLLVLISKNVILVPLTKETEGQHDYFLKESKCQYVFKENIQ